MVPEYQHAIDRHSLDHHSSPLSKVGQYLFFQTIPPERVGLSGEYDHNGLSKRVELSVNRQFQYDEIAKLRIRQRGGIILLLGDIPNQSVLMRLVDVVMKVEGTTGIEVNGASIVHPFSAAESQLSARVTTSNPIYAY
ncbi:MAG: hypothetical protein KME20_08450 [Kaiparowitsia implicata GSE-PSE-MK54-09C]|jgi:osmotically-inducible protein OsmY|nr:hypothetical protein [Kaiparowitsia implicata GSE-PSE-MK54-09C]